MLKGGRRNAADAADLDIGSGTVQRITHEMLGPKHGSRRNQEIIA
jgi:hypothetical protein